MFSGKFRRGGIPDVESAARSLINDWNTGKIKYCTQPPEAEAGTHISASIVSDEAREFEIDNFDQMETDVLNNFTVKVEDTMEYTSSGPVQIADAPENDEDAPSKTHIIESIDEDEVKMEDDDEPKHKRGRKETVKKQDPQMLLEGKIQNKF